MSYFLDSYAIIEIIKGNSKYAMYLSFECRTSVFNLYEIAYRLLQENEEAAVKNFSIFLQYKVEIEDNWFVEAAKFRLKNKGRKLSYADCIGYIASLKTGLVFLTGDREFKGMENVEFVS